MLINAVDFSLSFRARVLTNGAHTFIGLKVYTFDTEFIGHISGFGLIFFVHKCSENVVHKAVVYIYII